MLDRISMHTALERKLFWLCWIMKRIKIKTKNLFPNKWHIARSWNKNVSYVRMFGQFHASVTEATCDVLFAYGLANIIAGIAHWCGHQHTMLKVPAFSFIARSQCSVSFQSAHNRYRTRHQRNEYLPKLHISGVDGRVNPSSHYWCNPIRSMELFCRCFGLNNKISVMIRSYAHSLAVTILATPCTRMMCWRTVNKSSHHRIYKNFE